MVKKHPYLVHQLLYLFLLSLLPYSLLQADNSVSDSDQYLVTLLRSGGYNLYFRHESTDWSQSDQIENRDDWLSCDGSKIRQLSTSGKKSAKATGNAMRQLKIPVAKIFSSPYCRTVETAELLGLGKIIPTADVMNLRVADYFGGRSAIVETAQRLLSQKPVGNSNNIIVAHGNVAREATRVYPDEGEAIIFQPDGESFKYINRIKPSDWVRLKELTP